MFYFSKGDSDWLLTSDLRLMRDSGHGQCLETGHMTIGLNKLDNDRVLCCYPPHFTSSIF